MCFSDVEPGIGRVWIVFCKALIVAQSLLILISLHSDLTQVECDVRLIPRVCGHGFVLQQVIFCLIKALIHIYEQLGHGHVSSKAILNSQ